MPKSSQAMNILVLEMDVVVASDSTHEIFFVLRTILVQFYFCNRPTQRAADLSPGLDLDCDVTVRKTHQANERAWIACVTSQSKSSARAK